MDGIESKQLLLVAGPSGSGKTVFINQFRAGTLAPELSALLPAGAAGWPQIGANDCMKRGVALAAVLPKVWEAPGGVAHYDTAYVQRFGQMSYSEDPVAELFRRVARACVVSIAPPAGTLKSQFESRRAELRGRKKASHLFWRDHVRAPVDRLLWRLKGHDPLAAGELYDDPLWLDRCYGDWNTFVREVFAAKPGSRLVTLEPCLDSAMKPSFRVIPG